MYLLSLLLQAVFAVIVCTTEGSLIVQPPGPGQSVLRVTEGRELQLTCIYRGSGAEGELTWAGPAVRQGRARITRSGPNRSRLEFSPLSASDNGTYVCLFANEAATIEIIVHTVDCGNLTNPANGQVNHTAGTTSGQTATYSCESSYNLVGDSTRTCQATGVWSGSAPTCQIVVCGTLTNPANGQVSHTAGTTFAQTATYSCSTCFNLVGDNTRTCQATGMWSGSAPTCQIVVCGTLTNPANGQVSHTAGTTFGQTATYSCNTGYILVGNNTHTCQATGVWSGSAPTCQALSPGTIAGVVVGTIGGLVLIAGFFLIVFFFKKFVSGRILKHESPAAPLSVTQIRLHGNIEYKEVQRTSTP